MANSPSHPYYADVRDHNLEPLWTIPEWFLPSEPMRGYRPYQWCWETVKPRLLEAGRHVVPGEGGSRRVLVLAHPDLRQSLGTTHTLNAAMQMILPGEQAPAHRHTPLAIRFIISGTGASTIVNGETITMQSGDFLLTPRWAWHDHRHDGEGPMIWLDGLDIPISRYLDAVFTETFSENVQRPSVLAGQSTYLYGTAGVVPTRIDPKIVANAGLMVYPWEATRRALDSVRKVARDPDDGVIVEYRNPLTGGPVLPTLGATMQSLLPGESTRMHRHTSSAIYYVYRGHGSTVIEGTTYHWSPGDVLVLPPWCFHRHENRSTHTEEALLFAMTDEPVLTTLHLYREEAMEE